MPDPFAERLRAADLDRYLATLYAPAEARPALFALHALDLELLDVVLTTSQPMIGLVRLAWWREALERLDSAPPPAQPLLQALAERLLPRGVSGAMLSEIEAGFAALLLEEPLDIEAYKARGGALFAAAAVVLGGDAEAARGAGETWATAELLRIRPDVGLAPFPAHSRESPSPRQGEGSSPPLRGLAVLASRDLARGRPGRRGAPGRQLRLLWSIFLGR